MSNIERAAETVKTAIMEDPGTARSIAQALADEGRLAPDLPEPDRSNGTWTDWGGIGAMPEASVKNDGTLMVYDDGRMTEEDPKVIREIALIYLAAANLAEEYANQRG